jgi:rare lipoprotein A (peptidoglycan hydrolase)
MTMMFSQRLLLGGGLAGALLLLAGCSSLSGRKDTPTSLVPPAPQLSAAPLAAEETPKPEGQKGAQVGTASWYGPAYQGKETANGETFDQNQLTAAHPTLPLGTKATVTNLESGKSVNVTITDRGPYEQGRKIDLSRAAAQKIGMAKKGVATVKIEARPRRTPTQKVARQTTKRPATPVATRTDLPTGSPQ